MASAAAPTRHRRTVVPLVVVAALAYSWLAGHFTTFTRPAEVATFIPGFIAVVVACRAARRSSSRPSRSASGWVMWWVIVGAFAAIEAAALALGADHAHPTVSDLVNPWLLSDPSRAAAFALWLGLGYWLARR